MNNNARVLQEKLLKAYAQLPYLWRALALIWTAARGWTIAWFVLLVLQGFLPVATVYLTKALVDMLLEVIAGGEMSLENMRPLLMIVAAMVVVLLTKDALRSVTGMIRIAQSERIRDFISGLIHQKSVEIDLEFYDSPEYYDQLHRARVDASHRPMALLENIGTLIQNGITLVAMALVLVPYGLWLPLALLISTLPAFYVVLHHRLRLNRWRLLNTAAERQSLYYDWLLTVREAATELRLFQLSDHFQTIFQNVRRRLRSERYQLARDQGLADFGASLVALLVTGIAMLWMVWRVVQGVFTLGDLALFYQAFNQGQGLTRSVLENVGEIYNNSLFLSDLFEFLELEPKVVDPPAPSAVPERLLDGIRFENITFRYPGSQRAALDEFSLSVEAGQIIAIVGVNGAGKSTLIKLLCRFYDPQAGAVYLDGVDLREFAIQDLRRNITVLFQEPMHYNATVRQNIALGDLEIPLDSQAIVSAAQGAGVDKPAARLSKGYDTLLGKWFEGGTDLSVGEWQRIALARAFLRQASIIVLDEPTSAMDPWAEADWLARFRSLAAGRTAIIITHRFTTAAFADVVHVMDRGRIVESGDHHELMAGGGRYAQSWKTQMERWMTAPLSVSPGEGISQEEPGQESGLPVDSYTDQND